MAVCACLQSKNHIFTCYRINFKLQMYVQAYDFIFFHFYSTKIKRTASETTEVDVYMWVTAISLLRCLIIGDNIETKY
jgi:hypothetical protein